MDIQEYLRIVTPTQVLELLDRPLLDNLLAGYCFALGAGITLLYPRSSPPRGNDLDRIDARAGGAARETFDGLCACWRDPAMCDQEGECVDADCDAAMLHFSGPWSGLRIYRCRPLGLWDMSYPLQIAGRTIGVLFGGQVIVDGEARWREELAPYANQVDWSTCPSADNQLAAIRTHIASLPVPEDRKEALWKAISPGAMQERKHRTVQGLRDAIEDFRRFGDMTQKLLVAMHRERKQGAEQELMRSYDDKLTRIDKWSPDRWWREYERFLQELSALGGATRFSVWVRERRRYVREVPRSPEGEEPPRLSARDIVSHFPYDTLTPATNESLGRVLTGVAAPIGPFWGYHSRNGEGDETCSSLIVARGVLLASERALWTGLCRVFCSNADFAHLLFRERQVDVQYRKQVGLIGHNFRTPLQNLRLILEELGEAPAMARSASLTDLVRDGLERIDDAKEELIRLLDLANEGRESFDLAPLVQEVLDSMAPMARNHPCELVRLLGWPAEARVRAIKAKIKRALVCLVDNAIKYSYVGPRAGGGGLFQVTVGLQESGSLTTVTIVNYGIGIPKAKMEAIRKYGLRGKVPDAKVTRSGTGLGLPYAIDAFEEAGGRIEVASQPAPSATPEEIASYHRYITTVQAMLPSERRI